MAAHTPKGTAIETFLHHEASTAKDWILRLEEEAASPAILIHARRDDQVGSESLKSLEIHTRQIRLHDDELDEATKTMIRRWMNSL